MTYVLDHLESLIECTLGGGELFDATWFISFTRVRVVPTDVGLAALYLIAVKLELSAWTTGIVFLPGYIQYRKHKLSPYLKL